MDGESVMIKRKRRLARGGSGKRFSARRRRGAAARRRKTGVRRRGRIRLPDRSRLHGDYAAGERDGAAWRGGPSFQAGGEALKEAVLRQWNVRFRHSGGHPSVGWKQAASRGKRYASGFMQGAGIRIPLCPVPISGRAAAIVCAGTNEVALRQVLARLAAIPVDEIVIVAGSPTPGMFQAARSCNHAVVACLPEAVHPDVGRALGSKLTDADTVLFVDGERPASEDTLAGLLWACEGKLDVALSDLSGHRGLFHHRLQAEWLFEFLNASLHRRDLSRNSLSVLPYALSRRALDTLGAPALSVPAKAHALAILKGLRIGTGAGGADDGGRSVREAHMPQAAGDHAEAWTEAFHARGKRLYFADRLRNRSVLGAWGR